MPADEAGGAALPGKRLLFVVNDLAFLISHRLEIVLAAVAAGARVEVAAPPDQNSAARLADHGIRAVPIPMSRHGMNPFREFRSLLALYGLMRRTAPDLVHLITVKPVVFGGIAARLAHVPAMVAAISGLGFVFDGRGARSRMLRLGLRPLYRAAMAHRNARAIFQNPTDRQRLTALCPGIASELIAGSGVDLVRFAPAPEPDGPATVLLPARLLRPKGIAEFVEAARRLRASGTNARFVVLGDAPASNPATIPQEQIETWRRQGNVAFEGFCDDMPAALGAAHLVVLPSYYGEGLPKVLLEAAACGRAVITTDHPGCRDAVVPGQTGLLVPPRDPAALAGAIGALLTDPERRRSMGQAARAHAERNFAVSDVVDRHLAIYRALLAPARTAAAQTAA
ncbi:MAG: glycosyltransferase family 4 protein [Paracoccaceae bacterium]|nr:glycosyltransferase family 4 protein [Paracoccaceae bacterium]